MLGRGSASNWTRKRRRSSRKSWASLGRLPESSHRAKSNDTSTSCPMTKCLRSEQMARSIAISSSPINCHDKTLQSTIVNMLTWSIELLTTTSSRLVTRSLWMLGSFETRQRLASVKPVVMASIRARCVSMRQSWAMKWVEEKQFINFSVWHSFDFSWIFIRAVSSALHAKNFWLI